VSDPFLRSHRNNSVFLHFCAGHLRESCLRQPAGLQRLPMEATEGLDEFVCAEVLGLEEDVCRDC